MKKCSRCGQMKPLENFNRDKSRVDGHVYWCRDCSKEYASLPDQRVKRMAYEHKRYAERETPEQREVRRQGQRAWKLRTKYGMTPEEYDKLSQAQGGVCGICYRDLPLMVDHDHETGKVRGLLCSPCNLALGQLGDNIEGLQDAIFYLWQEDR